MRKWATSSPVSAGLALVVAGVIAIFLAWNGAAGRDYIEGQLPYLISGGLIGLSLVGAGLVVVNVQTRRQDQAELLNRLEELMDLMRASRPEQVTEEEPPRRRGQLRAS